MSVGTDRDVGFREAAAEIAESVAAPAADEVDRQARFPHEALDRLREMGALGAFIPLEYGGRGVTLGTIAAACCELARGCSSAGMIFAMHQIQVGCLVRHAAGERFFDDYLTAVAAEQRLIASVTSEVGVGGDLRSSIAALVPDGDALSLEKHATTVSYGAHADDLLVTARRTSASDRSDQVLVLARVAECDLEQAGAWDSLGMRGTCSPPYVVHARVGRDQVIGASFAQVAAQTMVPFSHILWAHVWLGIATAACDRARAFVRGQARRAPETTPPTAGRLSALIARLYAMRSEIAAATAEYAAMIEANGTVTADELFTVGFALRINALKITASELAPELCAAALRICGMAGYVNTSPYSVGRHLRDAHSAALMIANERIHATNAGLLLVHKAG